MEFVFKTKIGFSDLQKDLLLDDIPSNIKMVYEGTGHNLLLDASVVVGFNTTAVFEAIASGCQVVSPELFSEVPDSLKDFVFYLGDSAYLPRNSNEFHDIVLDLLEKNKFPDEILYTSDNLIHHLRGLLLNDGLNFTLFFEKWLQCILNIFDLRSLLLVLLIHFVQRLFFLVQKLVY